MNITELNHIAVLVAALSMFALGGLWYSPVLLGKIWMRANGFTAEDLQRGSPLRIFALSLICSLVMAYNLAMFLSGPETTVAWGATAGFLAGFGWVALSVTMIAQFERRPAAYVLVNGGYVTVAFTVMGAILGAWR
jgi:hypothetical protein